MSNRGVILVLFDLPSKTKAEQKSYIIFRKNLKKNGYMQLQESIYVKLLRNSSTIKSELLYLDKIAPEVGSVLALPLTLNEFSKTVAIRDSDFDFNLFSNDILFI